MKKILIVEDESLVAHHLKLILGQAGYKVCGTCDSVEEALENIERQKPDLVLLDIHLKGNLNGIDLARQLTGKGIAFVYLTANFQGRLLEEAKATLPFGFIVKPFREDDLITALDVAFFRIQNSLETLSQQELNLSEQLKVLSEKPKPLHERLLQLAHLLQNYVPFDYLNIVIHNQSHGINTGLGFLRVGYDEYQNIGAVELAILNQKQEQAIQEIYNHILNLSKPVAYNAHDFESMVTQQPLSRILADAYNIESALFFPINPTDEKKIRFEFYNRRDSSYSQQHITLLSRLQSALLGPLNELPDSKGVGNSDISKPSVSNLKEFDFGGLISVSPLMHAVKNLMATVSPLDTSVIILGESGTGKERVAKGIHSISARRDKPLITVNCASLPASLVESELFGHEKGAFTSAIDKRIGKFELAHNGTIFLDEIGELSADLQVKLLRVLQEQEIERIGGRSPIKINVRIIAATNRNLESEMEAGRFRLDLYYRLYVFPILLPSLRERPEDIEVLAKYFISRFSKRYNLEAKAISPEVLDEMSEYPWPGNVRELEHFIERTLLLSKGPEISEISLPRKGGADGETEPKAAQRMKTINENERDYIIAVLKKCNGRIRGVNGAAVVMGLPPTTLHSKMKRLGII